MPAAQKARVTLDLGDLGQWPLELDAAILGRLKEQAAADGRFVLADRSEARRLGKWIGEALLSLVRREFAPPTAAQVKYARAIAERLQLDVPADVWESKPLLSEWIASHQADDNRAREDLAAPPGPRRID